MPNNINTQTQYVVTGNPDTVNQSAPYPDAGQLGQRLEWNDRTYQYVQVDSAAQNTYAAGDVAFWKDKNSYLVTKDPAQSNGARNNVAGIFRMAVTPGYYGYVLQRGDAITVKSDGNGAAGDIAIANSGTSADVTRVAAGTAPTYLPLGKINGAASGGFISVDLNIQAIP